jgi:phage host-nuclease inhibitor protein Gam
MRDLAEARAKIARLTADRDGAVNKVMASYCPSIDAGRAVATEMKTRLCVYYMLHLAEIEKDGKRSIQLACGVMGRRLSPVKLTPLNRSWGWDAIKAALQARFGSVYLRMPEPEIDKEGVKALVPEVLHEVGLKVVQDEKFYAEPAEMPAGREA